AKDDQLSLKIKGPRSGEFQVVLKAKPQEGDPAGKSSRFVGTDDRLGVEQDFEGTASGAADGAPYTGNFKAEPATWRGRAGGRSAGWAAPSPLPGPARGRRWEASTRQAGWRAVGPARGARDRGGTGRGCSPPPRRSSPCRSGPGPVPPPPLPAAGSP